MYKYRIIIILSNSLSSLPLGRKNALSFVPIVTGSRRQVIDFRKRSMTSLISLRPLPADRVQGGKFSLLQET